LLGREADRLLQHLAAKLSEKWEKPYSVVCGYIRTRISLAILRATHLCLRGSRIPASQISHRRVDWDGGAGVTLFSTSQF
jgi:hypothetical protein